MNERADPRSEGFALEGIVKEFAAFVSCTDNAESVADHLGTVALEGRGVLAEFTALRAFVFIRTGVRDLINAGIDPHRWFAGVMEGLIDVNLDGKDDPKWVADLNAFLKANIPDKLGRKVRQQISVFQVEWAQRSSTRMPAAREFT